MKRVIIYTDGGCDPNPGVGGWAAILRHGNRRKELVGGELDTTNNRMEMLAAINALEALREPCEVEMHTDSQYVQKGITEWVPKWKANGWARSKRSGSAPLKNVELWKRLEAAAARHRIEWKWIRGHAGDPDNERCDELCAEEIARQHAKR